MQYASQNLIPVTLELGGKSPNIFFEDVCQQDDDFFDKAIEGFVMFALNQGEVCTCPSRALIQESIYDLSLIHILHGIAGVEEVVGREILDQVADHPLNQQRGDDGDGNMLGWVLGLASHRGHRFEADQNQNGDGCLDEDKA